MRTAVFRKFKNGYFTFEFDKGEDMVFEEVHPKALAKYDLKRIGVSLFGLGLTSFKFDFSFQLELYVDK